MDYDVIIHEGVGHDEDPPGRGSGRYGWGTGDNPYQHQFNIQTEVSRLRKKGYKDGDIAKMLLGPTATTTNLRAELTIFEKTERKIKMETAMKILDECGGNKLQAAKKMGVPPSSFYKLVDPVLSERTDRYFKTADFIRNKIDTEGRPVDVSSGTEYSMGVKKDTKDRAIAMLEKEGYVKATALVPQQGQKDKMTTITVLCPPGTPINEKTYADGTVKRYVSWKQTGIASIVEYSPDEGKTFWTPEYPASLDSKRVFVRYGDQGGADKDGVIEIRKGVKDLSLGKANYAQLRVMVDGDHYMKGMAIYSDDVPPGYDIIYNTNKKTGSAYEKVFKGCKVSISPEKLADHLNMPVSEVRQELKKGFLNAETVDDLKALGIKNPNKYIDKDNPFGASIKLPKERDGVISAGGQYYYEDPKGSYIFKNGKYVKADGRYKGERYSLSPVNKLTEEGDWDSWSKNLSSQFLSKQPIKIINQQLNLSIATKADELDQIKNLTNPVIKKKLLEDFARGCDANAADLSATGFRKQAFQVILPVTSLKDTECYAPRFNDGEQLALIRYPHSGPFEIPIVTVNNKHTKARSILGQATDAIGINANVAGRLSGADFDGDTVLAIPMTTNKVKIQSTPMTGAYEALKGFDTKTYKTPDDHKTMTNSERQMQMGLVTNLIADMTVGGAGASQIVKAVKHSMVVVDSPKHNLDWKRSMEENNIITLKKEYQGVNSKGQAKGASTILTRAKGETYIPHRKEINDVNKMTPEERKAYERGEIVWRETGKTKKSWKTGQEKAVTQKVHQMDTTTNAFDLVKNPANMKEVAYANYANDLKDLANQARKEARSIKAYKINIEAKKTYRAEVESLRTKLDIAKSNAPRERKAQELATAILSEKFKNNPEMDYEHKQRERQRTINYTRSIVGAKKDPVEITDREWEAIQARAVSTNMLNEILNNTNQDKFKQRAIPRKGSNTALSKSQINLAKSMYASGMYTLAEIADRLGVSASTISKTVKE